MRIKNFVRFSVLILLMLIMIKIIGLKELRGLKMNLSEVKDAPNVLTWDLRDQPFMRMKIILIILQLLWASQDGKTWTKLIHRVCELQKDTRIWNFGILIGGRKAVLQEWLRFQREKNFISRSIAGVSTAWEIQIVGEKKIIGTEL